MNINLNVKIKAGKRTQIDVGVYPTSVNEKIIEFNNGKTISEIEIADYLQKTLTNALKQISEETKS